MSKIHTKELLDEAKEKNRKAKKMVLDLATSAESVTKEVIRHKLMDIYKELK